MNGAEPGTSSGARDDAGRDPWLAALERVLRGEGLALAFQPIIDLKHGAVVGYEAQTRFASDSGIDAGPREWSAAADRLGVGAELEARVIALALDARDRLPPNTFLAVGISPSAVDAMPVRRLLEGPRGLHRLVILVAEAALEDHAPFEAALAPLRGRGAFLAVDAAGARYESLSHVLRLRPNFLKIDPELVNGLDADEAKRALVEMLVRFARRVDAWPLGDGVGTAAELATLAGLGVPLAQGDLLGRPVPHWGLLAPEVRQQLLRSSDAEQQHNVGSLVEPWPFLEEGRELEGLQLVREALEPGAHQLSVLPVLDGSRRPVALFSMDHTGSHASPRRPLTQLRVTAPVTDAARRAMSRPIPRRFDPMACVDHDGTYLGVVRVERLIEALTRALEGGDRRRAGRAA